MRRTAHEAAATRSALLEAARALFAEQGYEVTTNDQIVDRAGVTQGALYHHFGSKRELFRAVFVAIEVEMDAKVRTAAAEGSTIDEAFLLGCRAVLEHMSQPEYQQIGLADATAVLGMRTWHEIDTSIGLATVEGAVQAMQDAGWATGMPSRPLAVLLFGALTHACISVANAGPDSIDDYLTVVSGLLDALRTADS